MSLSSKKSHGRKRRVSLARRRFLKQSTLGLGSLLGLTGCANLDSLFTSGKREFEKEVFVIGGGAAGLMAAHTLKKNRIPFRLFEASNRPGGRLYTVTAADGSAFEMGADTFESHHRLVFELLKEFQIEWEESLLDPSQWPLWRSSRGDLLSETEYQQLAAPVIQRMIADRVRTFGIGESYQILSPSLAQELDALSMAQLLRVHWVQPDDRVVQYWEARARSQYAIEADKVSALRWVWDQHPERRTRTQYRVKGGWESLNRALYDRIAGVIPEHLVRLRWALNGIRKTEEGFRCVFKTPKGTEVLETHNLILALPANQYAKIDGFLNLDLPEGKKQALRSLRLGESGKTFVNFKSGTLDQIEKSFYRNQVQLSYVKTASHDWIGGLRGGSQSPWTLPDIENWRSGLFSKGSVQKEGQFDYHVLNWKDKPFIQGARTVWEPGQWGAYSTLFEQGDFNESLLWAGEFVPAHEKGTVYSALLSGQTAALKMVEKIRALMTVS